MISREQVEKMRGRFFQAGIDDVAQDTWRCSRCLVQEFGNIQGINFCPSCGAPMTDEAVDMMMKRLEALYEWCVISSVPSLCRNYGRLDAIPSVVYSSTMRS